MRFFFIFAFLPYILYFVKTFKLKNNRNSINIQHTAKWFKDKQKYFFFFHYRAIKILYFLLNIARSFFRKITILLLLHLQYSLYSITLCSFIRGKWVSYVGTSFRFSRNEKKKLRTLLNTVQQKVTKYVCETTTF